MKISEKLTNIIESILFVSGTQVSVADITEKLQITEKQLNSAVKALQEKYSGESGIQLITFNKKLQFCSNPEYAEEVASVLNPIREKELSKSMLEVAAIIAYKQPVTRIDLEELRGGNSEYAIQKLLELGVIEPVGRKDAVGRPVLFGTTDKFLKRFQISSLDELPKYEELIEQIHLLNQNNTVQDDYLYKKDEYVDPSDIVAEEVAVSADEAQAEKQIEETTTQHQETLEQEDDFDLPDLNEEEIPDFLQGEEVEKF